MMKCGSRPHNAQELIEVGDKLTPNQMVHRALEGCTEGKSTSAFLLKDGTFVAVPDNLHHFYAVQKLDRYTQFFKGEYKATGRYEFNGRPDSVEAFLQMTRTVRIHFFGIRSGVSACAITIHAFCKLTSAQCESVRAIINKQGQMLDAPFMVYIGLPGGDSYSYRVMKFGDIRPKTRETIGFCPRFS
tara:strand:- start:6782 stop:7342 length:561 start_codon:yes stop_codon:yes gene_type:complete